MGVSEVVGTCDLAHVRSLDDDRARRATQIDGVDNNQRVRAAEQLLHEVDAADAHVEYLHAVRYGPFEQPLRDCDPEAVVAAQDVADARDNDPHVEEDTARMEAIRELEDRLARYDPERYPVQHATARFHLGLLLTDAGRIAEAVETLSAAAALFDPERLPVEHAKALNALGAALRLAGDAPAAANAFEQSAALFEAKGQAQERGAALFNLGLVRRENDPAEAAHCFRQARALLDGAAAAAAARELGTTLLALGELGEAIRTLENALALAVDGNPAGYGGTANALGLAQLAAGDAEAAAASFRAAVGAHPRGVRPEEFAMAKANLALAYEWAGSAARARLAARQALSVPEAPPPVERQARGVLGRLPAGADDLLEVLAEEPRERWGSIVREELARSLDATPDERRSDAAVWVDAPQAELVETWLGVLLELPPEAMEALVRATLEARAAREEETAVRFREQVSRGAARFHAPQLLRIEDTFRRIAGELGQPWTPI